MKKSLEQRVIATATQILHEQYYVSSIDVLLGIGYLQPTHLKEWRYGRVPYLEDVIYVSLNKISQALRCFRQWTTIHQGLKPRETTYYQWRRRGPKCTLQFSKSGDPAIERAYRTHYVSPVLSEKKCEQLQEKWEASPEQVVFYVLREGSECVKCHEIIPKGGFLLKEDDDVLCMRCSEFSAFLFLPSGDPKLTRRAKKYSKTYAVVVKFSRARKRYERKGLLVEEAALEKAQSEISLVG